MVCCNTMFILPHSDGDFGLYPNYLTISATYPNFLSHCITIDIPTCIPTHIHCSYPKSNDISPYHYFPHYNSHRPNVQTQYPRIIGGMPIFFFNPHRLVLVNYQCCSLSSAKRIFTKCCTEMTRFQCGEKSCKHTGNG